MKQNPRHRPQPSKTLMRHAVKQPGSTVAAKSSLKVNRQLDRKPAASIAPKTSVNLVENSRLIRARSVQKSRSISRFSSSVFDYQAMLGGGLTAARPRQTATPSAPVRPTTALLERAIQQAESHRTRPPRAKRKLGHYLQKLRPAHAS